MDITRRNDDKNLKRLETTGNNNIQTLSELMAFSDDCFNKIVGGRGLCTHDDGYLCEHRADYLHSHPELLDDE
jgi:hypothetical protein